MNDESSSERNRREITYTGHVVDEVGDSVGSEELDLVRSVVDSDDSVSWRKKKGREEEDSQHRRIEQRTRSNQEDSPIALAY